MEQRDREQGAGEGRRAATDHDGPDSVETRFSDTQPIPRRNATAWFYAIPVVALVIAGTIWMFSAEVMNRQQPAPPTIGTSGERDTGHDPEGAQAGEPLNPVPQGPAIISDVGLLSDKDQYVGRTVRFVAVPVLVSEGPRTFWVGRPGDRALVLADPSAGTPQMRSGEMVALEGTLERRPDDGALARAGLTDDDRDAIKGEDVLIRATRVERANVPGTNEGASSGQPRGQ